MKEVFGKDLRINTILQIYSWILINGFHIGINLELESIGGNFYLNYLIITFIQSVSSIFSIFLIMKFDNLKMIRLIFFISGCLFSIYLFKPENIEKFHYSVKFIFIISILLNQVLLEIFWNLTIPTLPKLFPLNLFSIAVILFFIN